MEQEENPESDSPIPLAPWMIQGFRWPGHCRQATAGPGGEAEGPHCALQPTARAKGRTSQGRGRMSNINDITFPVHITTIPMVCKDAFTVSSI